jgi:hypothetical protein
MWSPRGSLRDAKEKMTTYNDGTADSVGSRCEQHECRWLGRRCLCFLPPTHPGGLSQVRRGASDWLRFLHRTLGRLGVGKFYNEHGRFPPLPPTSKTSSGYCCVGLVTVCCACARFQLAPVTSMLFRLDLLLLPHRLGPARDDTWP